MEQPVNISPLFCIHTMASKSDSESRSASPATAESQRRLPMKQCSVTDMIRQMDPAASANKRGRSVSGESASPNQRGGKARDTGDWSKFESVLEGALDKLRLQIQADFDDFRNSMKEQFIAMGTRLREVENKLEQKEKQLSEMNDTVKETNRELHALKEQVEDNELVSRLPSLVLSGAAVGKRPPPGPDGENVEQLVVDTLKKHFRDLPVKLEDIDRAHRLPGESGQKLICRFVKSGRGSIRDVIYQRRMELRGRELYINESLTRRRSELFQILLRAKKSNKIYTVFSRYGQVFYKRAKLGKSVRVTSVIETLKEFETT